MEISGKIVQILPEEKGEGRNGPWKKQSFVLETREQFPKKVCITVWGDKIDLKSFGTSEEVTASINIESREYNGRWYTDVKAWKVARSQPAASGPGAPPPADYPPDNTVPPETEDEEFNDLPF